MMKVPVQEQPKWAQNTTDEDALMESIDNLDMLLANIADKKQKEEVLQRLGKNYGISNKNQYQQPF